jgi:hypothetical protein
VDIADRLAGKLLLIHGEMDDQVHPDHTLRLVDRLIAADPGTRRRCDGPEERYRAPGIHAFYQFAREGFCRTGAA